MFSIVFYYNFGWKDYEIGSLEGLLDAVKVLSFAVNQGKVAVHCHAGVVNCILVILFYHFDCSSFFFPWKIIM